MFDSGKYTSASIKRLRKKLKASDDKDGVRMEQMRETIDLWIQLHSEKVKKGHKVNVGDFEKMVKLQMLMMDKPTDIVENRTDVESVEEVQLNAIEQMPEYKSLKEQIAAMMNAQNEEGKRKE